MSKREESIGWLKSRRDLAFDERNHLVAALARLFPSGTRDTADPAWSDDWRGCCYIDLPTGQVAYHYHRRQAELFAGLPPYTKPWDGHTKDIAHQRLAALYSGKTINTTAP